MAILQNRSAAQILVSDGSGALVPLVDHVAADDDWPIKLEVSSVAANSWMEHFNAEIHARNWPGGGTSQLAAIGNAGSMTFNATGSTTPFEIQISWERPRNGNLFLYARTVPAAPNQLATARDFVDAVNSRHAANRLDRQYGRAVLVYHGLPWKGEVWLNETLRLGPPSKYPEGMLLGPQALIVDAICEGIGWQGVSSHFEKLIRELRIFLRVAIGIKLKLSGLKHGWVAETNKETGVPSAAYGMIGYIETSLSTTLPMQGSAPPAERREVHMPKFGPQGIHLDMSEQWVPQDIEALWARLQTLPDKLREQFLRAGDVLLAADSLWPDHRTSHLAMNVAACEALKPPGKKFDHWNAYDVVTVFLGPRAANELRSFKSHPQKVRSGHVHRGELAANELLTSASQDLFQDPSFDIMARSMIRAVRGCMIEWLRAGGNFGSYRRLKPKTECIRCQQMLNAKSIGTRR